MTIEFNLEELPQQVRNLLLLKSNQWKCSPSEALTRLLNQVAKSERIPAALNEEAARAAGKSETATSSAAAAATASV